MRGSTLILVASIGLALPVHLPAQQPAVSVDGDDITVRGCVTRATGHGSAPDILLWGRGDLMLAGVAAAARGERDTPLSTLSSRVFYWLDRDEDLSKYLGREIEITGELDDIEVGQIEIDREGEFTEIEMDLNGREEKARVPSGWLGGAREDAEFTIVARRIDVDDVRDLGACRR